MYCLIQQLSRRIGLANRSAVDELHNKIVLADVVKLADVGMIQSGDGSGLALRSLAESFGGRFDGDDAIEPRVAGLVYFAHTTRADGRKDLVGAEFVARRERHVLDLAQFTRSENK